MKSQDIRNRFLEFFKTAHHTVLPSASLVPQNDPTVLFNTAGMQPLVPYLLGRAHPSGKRLVNIQKCLRTGDIDDIGDNTHATFFEMMGNWSLGDYFKKEAIEWSFEFLTSKERGLGLDPQRLYVTIFKGDEIVSCDEETASIWRNIFSKHNVTGERIYFLGKEANWWPAVKKDSDTWSGPTGPCTEMFYDLTGRHTAGMTFNEYKEADAQQQIVEIWNDVFMEYVKENGTIVSTLENKNVDTGSGFERIVAVVQGKDNIFDTDLFVPIMNITKTLSSVVKSQRIIADHMRASAFLIVDGVVPSNTDRGYVLRRLLRRAIFNTEKKYFSELEISSIVDAIISVYEDVYKEIKDKRQQIVDEIKKEVEKFNITLVQGLREFEKIKKGGIISSQDAFKLFSSYGFPIELIVELALIEKINVDLAGFNQELKKHQDLSRTSTEQKFKSGIVDADDETVVKYHTATHLLHQALHDVLGAHVEQRGSNITSERLRFDFSHTQKMTEEEKKRVEDIVNEKIQAGLLVQSKNMLKDEAINTGARHLFSDTYGEQVSLYFIGETIDTAYSKEFCGGPHVENTKNLGHFKIQKEEAASAGVRRIKAILK